MERIMTTQCSRICWTVVLFLVVAVSPAAAQQPILSGLDLLATSPGLTEFDFSTTPIPAGFFGPGSDPFDGIILMTGGQVSPGSCPNDDLAGIDTIVQRVQDADVSLVGNSDTIDIEIVQLVRINTNDITVTFAGQSPQSWDVEVELSPTPAPTGQMTIRRTHAGGGDFDTNLPVLPKLTFTRMAETKVFDFALEARPPIPFQSLNDPWVDKPQTPGSCTSNWCPTPAGPLVLTASEAQLGADPVCLPASIPTLSQWMAILMLTLMLGVGAAWIRLRGSVRRGTAAYR